jgi:hypothetical protein
MAFSISLASTSVEIRRLYKPVRTSWEAKNSNFRCSSSNRKIVEIDELAETLPDLFSKECGDVE